MLPFFKTRKQAHMLHLRPFFVNMFEQTSVAWQDGELSKTNKLWVVWPLHCAVGGFATRDSNSVWSVIFVFSWNVRLSSLQRNLCCKLTRVICKTPMLQWGIQISKLLKSTKFGSKDLIQSLDPVLGNSFPKDVKPSACDRCSNLEKSYREILKSFRRKA